jgi:hypothetical protein
MQPQTVKSAIALLLAGGLALGVAGCGNNDDDDDNNTNNTSTSPDYSEKNAVSGSLTAGGLTVDSTTLAVTNQGELSATDPGSVSGLDSTDYVGAVDPNGSAWWDGWTVHVKSADGSFNGSLKDQDFHPLEDEIKNGTGTISPAGSGSCAVGTESTNTVDVFGKSFYVCEIEPGDLSAGTNYTLDNDHIYLLNGSIHYGTGDKESVGQSNNSGAGSGGTLTIEQGTMVMGRAGTSSHLVINRGSDIAANGTSDEPVIFGAMKYDGANNQVPSDADPTDLGGRGLWGGVIVSGWADVNDDDGDNQLKSEARLLGDSQAYFGGTDDTDDSGTIKYTVIAESGYTIRPDEEIQGLTLEAVGSGTTIHHLQVLGSDDDGVEWFGGKAGVDHVVINGASDDSLDMDNGFRGTVQYAILRQASNAGNHTFETDGKSDSDAGDPKSNPKVANVLALGNHGGGETRGARHREGIEGKWYNIAYKDDSLATDVADQKEQFTTACVDVADFKDGSAGTAPEYGGSYCDTAADRFDPDQDG